MQLASICGTVRPRIAENWIIPHVVHVRSVRPEPTRVAVAQFALLERSALIVGVPRDHRCASLTLAHAAALWVAAGKQLNLRGHASES